VLRGCKKIVGRDVRFGLGIALQSHLGSMEGGSRASSSEKHAIPQSLKRAAPANRKEECARGNAHHNGSGGPMDVLPCTSCVCMNPTSP